MAWLNGAFDGEKVCYLAVGVEIVDPPSRARGLYESEHCRHSGIGVIELIPKALDARHPGHFKEAIPGMAAAGCFEQAADAAARA